MIKEKINFKLRLPVIVITVLLSASCFLNVPGYCALDDDVSLAVSGGQKFLYEKFTDATDETGYYWDNSYSDQDYLAASAAAVAALIETGKYSDASYAAQVDKAVAYIKSQIQTGGSYGTSSYTATYLTGMSLVALSLYHAVNPQDTTFVSTYIQPAVDYFLNGQYSSGAWSYYECGSYCDSSTGDMSNTQFAMMGLWYAYHYVLNQSIPTETENSWAYNLLSWVRAAQAESGCFGYYEGDSFYTLAPMNGAGLWTLAMLGIDQTDTDVQESLSWFDSKYGWTKSSSYVDETWGYAYYYGIYAMAKGLTGMIPSDYVFTNSTGNAWVTDLKQAMVDSKTTTDTGSYYWYSGDSHDPGTIISTSWVLMTLSFADPGTESTKKVLPDTSTPDYPINGEGFVTLETDGGGATLSFSTRENIGQATKDDNVVLPIGAFDFTVNHVSTGGTAFLKITPPEEAMDSTNANSFIDSDGAIKDGLAWFKIQNGEWKGLKNVQIRLMPVGGPYTYIEVTLTDGGEEDSDDSADGTIVVPGCPGYGAIFSSDDNDNNDDDGGGGGCFINSLFTR